MATPDVSPTNPRSTHHISLEELDNPSIKYGFILNKSGNAINRQPRQGSNHVPFTQNDWSGGRGLKFAIDDRSRFADAKRLNTRRAGLITLGGLETYATGHRQSEQFMPSDASGVTWQALTGDNRFIAYKVTISATGNRARLYFWVRRRGNPGTLEARLKGNNAGDPGTEAKLVQVTTVEVDDTISVLYEFTFPSVQAVNNAATYWVEISGASGDDATDHWEVGTDASRTNALTKVSPSGSDGTWTNPTYDLYFRLVDDIDIAGAIPFNYKSQFYILTRPNGSTAPKLFMNGYRGVATGSGQSRTILKDTTLNAPTGSLVGKLLLIISGPNSEWSQPYRTITANDNTAKTIETDAFGKDHVAGETVYVILGTDAMTEITGHGLTVLPTSVEVAGEVVYFAQGDGVKMRKMQEYLAGGVWNRSFWEEDNYAKILLAYNEAKSAMIIKANDYDNSGRPSLAIAKAETWRTRLRFPLLLDACESTTGWTFSSNVTGFLATAVFQTGSGSIRMDVGATAPDLIGYRSFTSIPLKDNKKIRLWVYCSESLEAGALKLRISTSATCATALQDIDFPVLNAEEWTQVELPYKDAQAGITSVVTIGFLKTAHSGTVYIDGIEAMPAGSEVPLGNNGQRITGLELYGDPETPWVFRSGSIGSVENGVYKPIPLREYSQVENIHNGVGHLVHDVYLFFSFQQGIQQYYKSNLDDVGPNRDQGLPANRQGYATSMVGYPDRFLYNYDAGSAGYSSIMSHKGGGHHEDYRCDAAGKRIRFIFLQVIPGDMVDRLWFSEGEDIAYLPMPGNTVNELTDPTYKFTHEGELETGQIGDDQQRLFSSVKLGLENVSAARPIEWDYRLDETTAWTPMATPFTSGPVQSLPLNKTGKRLTLRFRPQTNSNTQTPRITSIFVATTEQQETRYSYSMTFEYQDNGRDLLDQAENYIRAETLLAKIDEWSTNKTPLKMRSISEAFDNKTVFIDPTPVGPISNKTNEQQEKQQGTLTVTEPP